MDEVDTAMGDSGEIGQALDGVDNTAESTDRTGSPRRPVGRPRTPPPRVRIELVLVDGPERRQLRQLQANAIRTVLQ